MSDEERKVPRRAVCSGTTHVWLAEDSVDGRCECGEFTRADWNNPDVGRVTFGDADEDAPTVPCIVTDDSSPGIKPFCSCPATSEYDPPCAVHGVLGIGVRGETGQELAAKQRADDLALADELQQVLDTANNPNPSFQLRSLQLVPWQQRVITRAIKRLRR